jgi:hypothetical protein
MDGAEIDSIVIGPFDWMPITIFENRLLLLWKESSNLSV